MQKAKKERIRPLPLNEQWKQIGSKIAKGFSQVGKSFQRFIARFKDGSVGTKISHFICGFGNLSKKQYAKGILFLGLQVIFLLFMISSPEVNRTPFGWKSLGNMITLGTEAGDLFNPTDNSMLMLLFGVVTIGIIAVFILVYLSNIKSSYEGDLLLRKGKRVPTFKEDIASLFDSRFHVLMLTPAMLGVLLFTVLPTLFMILIAFTNFDAEHVPGQHLIDWVGFANFAAIFQGTGEISARFLPVLTWTLTWAFFATFTNYISGILLALLINRKGIKLKKLWRTVFILTIALPQFISLLAMRNLLSLHGPINSALVQLGLLSSPIEFLGQATNAMTARITILVINLWIGIPYTMLMTSGILMNVPTDLYEAAMIDGATKRQAFTNITVPYILFVTAPYLITSFIGNITSFNIIFLLTGGDPVVPGFKAGQTDLLVTWLYSLTIEESEVNIGSVIAIFTFLITATATLISYRRSKSYKEEDAFQ